MTAGRNTPGGASGLVVLDKEPGWTSHDVVARTRRLLGQRRVGHAGTLDPDATGLLLVGLGRFTRMLRFITGLPKSYEGEVVLGEATSTLDASGEVVGTWDMDHVTLDEVRSAACRLTGDIMQMPPMVSAVKVGGKRLHELARAGIEVARAHRPVTVSRFEVTATADPCVYSMSVDCSTGTYVRSLAADLGTILGGGAHLRNLRRTRIGSFSLDEACLLQELGSERVLTPAQALRDLPHVQITDDLTGPVRHGLGLDKVVIGASGDGPWGIVDPDGRLMAVYEGTDTDRMVAAVVLDAAGSTDQGE